MITVTINGAPRQFNAPLTISELIVALDLTGKRVAIERNGDIVPRSQHAATPVADGDQFEIVVAVGGG
ncbi:sulfur carrier protein [Formivibrio citricus]|uniref:Sulfur carrier protein n=1 Tax=Formivibrio citricus TaxID=83765 RepID=A0A1I5DPF2_9NEIS|nr:sulfur carrier protein ThiS [Formivibrio citricus]SFO01094.1 sulfur carrier protein [Formivibrio citricus]